jgi:hypothetical protein
MEVHQKGHLAANFSHLVGVCSFRLQVVLLNKQVRFVIPFFRCPGDGIFFEASGVFINAT